MDNRLDFLNYKYLCFEYIMIGCIKWHNEWNKQNSKNQIPDNPQEYFTRLRANKLLFLLCSANENDDLLDIFDRFYAQIYGPVEGDIYNAMTWDKFKLIKFSKGEFICRNIPEGYFDEISLEDRKRIDKSFKKLKEKNFELITYTLFELIALVRRWSCWKLNYEVAKALEKHYEIIDTKYIREEPYKCFKMHRITDISYEDYLFANYK